jgi:hypothetical protein
VQELHHDTLFIDTFDGMLDLRDGIETDFASYDRAVPKPGGRPAT